MSCSYRLRCRYFLIASLSGTLLILWSPSLSSLLLLLRLTLESCALHNQPCFWGKTKNAARGVCFFFPCSSGPLSFVWQGVGLSRTSKAVVLWLLAKSKHLAVTRGWCPKNWALQLLPWKRQFFPKFSCQTWVRQSLNHLRRHSPSTSLASLTF